MEGRTSPNFVALDASHVAQHPKPVRAFRNPLLERFLILALGDKLIHTIWKGKRRYNTRSSTIRGFQVEALSRAVYINYRNVVPRCHRKNQIQEGPIGIEPIIGLGALASRCIHFRESAGCVSWVFVRAQVPGNFMNDLQTPVQNAGNIAGHHCSQTSLTSCYMDLMSPSISFRVSKQHQGAEDLPLYAHRATCGWGIRTTLNPRSCRQKYPTIPGDSDTQVG